MQQTMVLPLLAFLAVASVRTSGAVLTSERGLPPSFTTGSAKPLILQAPDNTCGFQDGVEGKSPPCTLLPLVACHVESLACVADASLSVCNNRWPLWLQKPERHLRHLLSYIHRSESSSHTDCSPLGSRCDGIDRSHGSKTPTQTSASCTRRHHSATRRRQLHYGTPPP